MRKSLLLLSLLGLASCAAPKAGGDAASPGVADSVKKPGTAPLEAGVPEIKPARPKPLLSGLFENKEAAVGETKAKPAPAPVSTPAAAPPERKSFFSFLRKKESPRAIVVEAPVRRPSPQTAKVEDTLPDLPKSDDGGLRLPDMLTMPEKKDFESTNPSAVKPRGDGAVIARPPTDPPARPKPKDESP